jgi:hypothetical protein
LLCFRKAAATEHGSFLPTIFFLMKNSFLILAGAAALSLASCSQEKTTETATTTDTTSTTTAADTDAAAEARAQRIADRMVADMKITDQATRDRIRTVYVNRYRSMGDVRSRYTTDTTGMAAAVREANAATDAEFKTIFTDPTQYQSYESSRSSYYEMENEGMSDSGMNSSDMSSSSTSGSGTTSSTAGSTSGSGNMSGSASGTMGGDGGKVKVKADGDVKIKDAQGNKLKVDGDDGTVKAKPENGSKTKIE